MLRLAVGRAKEPSVVVLDSRTLRSTLERGARAAWDGHKRTRSSNLYAAVDTVGQVLALHVTPANADNRVAVQEASVVIEQWQKHDNGIRPHSSLGYQPPAPEVVMGPAEPSSSTPLAHPAIVTRLTMQ